MFSMSRSTYILFSSFRGVALTNCVTDRTKTICLPTKVGEGDIILQIWWKKGNNCTMGKTNRISWNLVGSKDTICSCAYYQEILISWILLELCPFELRNFPKFTSEAACQCNSSETTKHKKNLLKSAKARITGTIPYCHGKVPHSRKLLSLCSNPNRFFSYDYSLWDGGRHMFLRAKTNFNSSWQLSPLPRLRFISNHYYLLLFF
jgi:hypothetical protein